MVFGTLPQTVWPRKSYERDILPSRDIRPLRRGCAWFFRRVSRANALAVALGGMFFRTGTLVRRMGDGIYGIDRSSCRGTHG
jgi:hypothetical protein